MNEQNYTVSELMADESFQAYVFGWNTTAIHHWQTLLEQNPELKSRADEAQKLLTSFSIKSHTLERKTYQADLMGLKKALQQNLLPSNKQMHLEVKQSSQNFPWQWAASILLVVGIGFGLFRFYQNREEQVETLWYKTISVPAGQKSTFKLPDGSKVVLNSQSTLKIQENFEQNRNLELEGEAFFEVEKDPAHPFVVKSGKLTTTALGTSFNVKAYPEDAELEVALVTGKVKVSKDRPAGQRESVILNPGQGVQMQTAQEKLKTFTFNPQQSLAWKEGTIYLKEARMGEIVQTLERWYGVQIDVHGQETNDRHFSGEFKGQSLENVLKLLSYSRNFTYTISGKQVEITFNTTK
ncbi:FecR domain-containing protein [Rapidithrix thailandica]|uniref:FecR domain-containing protein n=1 Tax=Rapidithrix thailandica TaxID=413964 RepID=A0AAW9RZX0_9BACT